MPAGAPTNWPAFQGCNDGLIRAFSRLVSRRPEHVLVTAPAGRATAADIDSFAHHLAGRIRAAGLPEQGIVGLAAVNGLPFLAGLLSLRQLGHPVLLLDQSAPVEDRSRALLSLGACAVVEAAAAWPASADEVSVSSLAEPHRLAPPGTAVIKLTSGSTGLPRGVAMTADSLLADEAALASTMGLTARDRLLAMIPMSHSYGFTTLALSALVRGLPLISPGTGGPLAPIEAARTYAATIVPTVPAYIQALLRLSQPPAWPVSLRRVITAGAVLTASTASTFRKRHGRPIHVFYGSSECGGICYDREGDAAERGTVGPPVDGVRITLASPGPSTGEGLVTVTSPAVATTYLPVADARLAGGTFETSDIAVWASGEIALRRRADGVINVRGRKVDPSEVERVLARLDGIEEAVVTSAAVSNREEHIVRAFVACPSGTLAYETISRWCQSQLADHKVPRSIVILDALPRTARGKIDRVALAALTPDVRAAERDDA